MVSIDLPSVATTELAKGVSNQSGFASLADVDVTTGQGAQDAMEVIDTAIEEIAVARGEMGAFQKNTLESNLTSLRIHTENLTAAESSIRDADIAVELAPLPQPDYDPVGDSQLAQANALPKNVMSLLLVSERTEQFFLISVLTTFFNGCSGLVDLSILNEVFQ